jgi:hypothetical protein
MIAASNRLTEEMGVLTKKRRPPKGGDVDKRQKKLLKEEFYDRYPVRDLLTVWEEAFLEATH